MNETFVVIVRAVIAFMSLLIFARMLGKQQISQLSFFDYISGITIGSIAATLTTDLTTKAWPHWIGLFVWVFLVYFFQWISLKGRSIAKLIDAEPTIVIMKGKIMEEALKETRYRASDILKLLRTKDVFDVSEVEYAVLESNGQISILKKPEHLPITPKDLGKFSPYKGLNTELIYDGKVVEKNLQQFMRDKEWLLQQIKQYGYNSFDEIFLMLIDEANNIFIDGYRDHMNKQKHKNLE